MQCLPFFQPNKNLHFWSCLVKQCKNIGLTTGGWFPTFPTFSTYDEFLFLVGGSPFHDYSIMIQKMFVFTITSTKIDPDVGKCCEFTGMYTSNPPKLAGSILIWVIFPFIDDFSI
jgi:hypothetical protein